MTNASGASRFCPNGHAAPADHRFCPQCGVPMAAVSTDLAQDPARPGAGNPTTAVPVAGNPDPTVSDTPVSPWAAPVGGPDAPTLSLSTAPTSSGPPSYSDPPPAGPPPTWGAPAPERRRRGWVVPVIVAAILLAGGGGAAVVFTQSSHSARVSASGSTGADAATSTTLTPATDPAAGTNTTLPPDTTTPTTAPPSTVAPGAPAAAAIATYLQQSAAVRPTVQNAINGVETCNLSAQDGENVLQQAITTRQQILTDLSNLDVSELPHGVELVSDLTQALNDSTTADGYYQQWMSDVGGSGQCNADPTQDSNYEAGQSASQSASADKASFLAVWNVIAVQYNEPTYTVTQI